MFTRPGISASAGTPSPGIVAPRSRLRGAASVSETGSLDRFVMGTHVDFTRILWVKRLVMMITYDNNDYYDYDILCL